MITGMSPGSTEMRVWILLTGLLSAKDHDEVFFMVFQNNAEYLLSLNFPPLLEIPKIQDQLLGTEQDERRKKSCSSTRGVTLNFVYNLDNINMNHLKVDRIKQRPLLLYLCFL